jgi:VCBS repeat-containing protein
MAAQLGALFSFDGLDGSGPAAGLTIDANGDLFGVTGNGGENGDGTVFEIQNIGTVAQPVYASAPTTLVSFNGTNGFGPEGLIIDANGNLFGTTYGDGTHNDGTAFEIQNTGTVAEPVYASTATTLANFGGGSNGAFINGALIADVNGDLFGEGKSGGANGDGTVFEITNSGFVPFTPLVSPDFTHVTFGQQGIVSAPGVLKNDQSATTGDTLTVSAVSVNGVSTPVSGSAGTTVTGHYGSLQIFADGHYAYTASEASALPSTGVSEDFFGYTAFDRGQHGSASASSTLTVVVAAHGLNVIGTGQPGVTIQGPNGNGHGPVLDGSAGNDTLIAGKAATILVGGPNDTLTANNGYSDAFVFMGDFGSDKITNYNSTKDVIQLSKADFGTNLAALAHDATQALGSHDTVITDPMNSHDTITLTGVSLSSLHFDASHFLLV